MGEEDQWQPQHGGDFELRANDDRNCWSLHVEGVVATLVTSNGDSCMEEELKKNNEKRKQKKSLT